MPLSRTYKVLEVLEDKFLFCEISKKNLADLEA